MLRHEQYKFDPLSPKRGTTDLYRVLLRVSLPGRWMGCLCKGMKLMGDLKAGLLNVLYPPRCYICGEHTKCGTGSDVCPSCQDQLQPLRPPLCQMCGKETGHGQSAEHYVCGDCLLDTPPFHQARSWFHYGAPVTTLLHRLKFLGDSGAAVVLARLIRQYDQEFAPSIYDRVIPVPLHPRRLRQRGLNQSLILARALCAKRRESIHTTTLTRIRDTVAQTGLDGAARRRNLRGAFALSGKESVAGQNICLIDDVFTTGTTVAECARVLKKAGAKSIDVWTVARA